jgi:tetratricopeptide (TPR) repeat protein
MGRRCNILFFFRIIRLMNNLLLNSNVMSKARRYFATIRMITASGLLAALFVNPVSADEISDVSQLLGAGHYPEALSKANTFLSQRPRDAQMRFLKGVILTEQNKTQEAIAIFSKLTADFPELPEPYNNLAVLYAADGQFEKARAALDKAIRTNPAYATAYENLGDIHAKLASQAYDKALQLDSKNSVAKSKLTMVRSLVDTRGGQINVAAAPATKTTPARPVPSIAQADKKKTEAMVPAIVTPEPKPAQIAKATVDAHKEASKAAQKPVPDSSAERTAVLNTVTGWANAWSAQDVKGYLSYYSNNFDTPNGMSRKAWIDERRARISGKGRIMVKVNSPQVTVSGNTATVKFRQSYVSDRLTANSRKTLEFTKAGDKWQIKQERTGN